jgi:hypothetical protein
MTINTARITSKIKGLHFETFKKIRVKKVNNEIFQLISANFLSSYIAYQIRASIKNRDVGFNKSISTGIFLLIRYYFAKFKKQNRINGISIICSGR